MRFFSALLPIAIAIAACACGDDGGAASPTPLPYLGLTLALEVGPPRDAEESIPMTFKLRNPGDDTVTIHSAGGCPGIGHFDLTVQRDGQELWSLSRHSVVCAALIPVIIEPGEEETFGDAWDRRDNDGQQVPPGTYTVSGVMFGLTEDGAPDFELRTEPVEFEVS
jgi:hypothetical protein